ncbi:PAS domain S-box protein [Methylotenera sp. 1P/1]|uniref:PAS domain S-box protein n=1 Tax=Methylotenera sp. 1P/1 TaxID=1131551 RepID=UPI000360B14A|nr:PAS domain S-box protein [Methylotenera sp. 1P/1]
MIEIQHFIYRDGDPTPLLYGTYDPWLVALSVTIAIGTSVLGMQLARVARKQTSLLLKQASIIAGSISLGAGIWAMHFIGMMALNLCTRVDYDTFTTILSMAPAVVASWYALHLLSGDKLTYQRLWLGGTLVGAGIGAMHYTGMLAMQMAPVLKFDIQWVLVSVVVAVVLATSALWTGLHLNQQKRLSSLYSLVLSGSLMGIAIAAMHYTGMASARILGTADQQYNALNNHSSSLSLGIFLVTTLIAILAAAINALIHYKQMLHSLQYNQSRLRTILETAVDGIITIDMNGRVLSFNHAAEQLFGWQSEEMLGKDTTILMPKAYSVRHNHFLKNFGKNGQAKILGVGREVTGVRKDGSTFPMRLAIGKADIPSETVIVGFITDLTQRNAMKTAVRERDEQLRSLMSNIPGVTFRCLYNQDWQMLLISESVKDLTGWTAEDFLKNKLSFSSFTHSDDSTRIATEVEEALAKGEHYAIEYRIRHRDGREKWVSEVGCAIRDKTGAVQMLDGVILDVTENKLKNAEFESIARAINQSTSVAEFTLDGMILDANPRFLTLLGYEKHEIIGRHHSIFCSAQDAASERYRNKWQALNRGEFVQGEFKRLGKNGSELWIHASYSPILNADGKPSKVLMFMIDISARIRMENDLKEAKYKAEQAASAKATFLANMSHEIRTPMNAVIGFSEIMMDTNMQDEQRRYMHTINSSAKSLLHLLNDILDSAKLEKGKLELEIVDFSLHELLDSIISTLWVQARRKHLELQLELAPNVAPYYVGAPDRIRQVLMNLLGNAIKFTEQGHVKLVVTQLDHQQVSFSVMDSGIGIPQDRLDVIFEPFTQADSSMSRKFGGTGLGTTISKQLVELMGGHLVAKSEIGSGSCFTMILPLQLGTVQIEKTKHQAYALPALRILVADDIRQNLDLISILLGRDGHHITTASNGIEAVQYFNQQPFDLILMDVQMPQLDGLGAATQIRTIETAQQLARTPIIALTASVLQEDRTAAYKAGMDGFASKPVDIDALTREMIRVLNGHTSTGADTPPSLQLHTKNDTIDLEKGLALWGSKPLYFQELARIVADIPLQMARLDSTLEQQNPQQLAGLAHASKGICGNLALPALYAQFAILEKQAMAGDLVSATDTLHHISTAWHTLHTWLAAQPATTPVSMMQADAAAYDIPMLQTQLTALAQAAQLAELDDKRMQAVSTMAPAIYQPTIQLILNAFNDFEFELAAIHIVQLQSQIQSGAH